MKKLETTGAAIKQAIRGGLEIPPYMGRPTLRTFGNDRIYLISRVHKVKYDVPVDSVLLNSNFWKRLAKARRHPDWWEDWANQWFDLRMKGGDISTFWRHLSKGQKNCN
jgi:hypothetical protein